MGAECSTETSALDWGPLGPPPGVRVIRVDSDGCAAGRLRVSDRIVCINGVPVSGHRDAMSALESSLNSSWPEAQNVETPVAKSGPKSEGHAAVGAVEIVGCIACLGLCCA